MLKNLSCFTGSLVCLIGRDATAIFKNFKNNDDWGEVVLNNGDLLFVKAVTRQFINKSKSRVVQIDPLNKIEIPEFWISGHPGSREQVIFSGTPHERKIISIESRPGGSLIKKSFVPPYATTVVVPNISLDDEETIDSHETDSIEIFPNLNERVYLCYKLKKNVDPEKDMMFDKVLPLDYLDYIEICCGKD